MGLSPELAGNSGAGQAMLLVVKRRLVHLKKQPPPPLALGQPQTAAVLSLPHQTSCPLEADAPFSLEGAWKGESYSGFFTGPGWTWFELLLPVL